MSGEGKMLVLDPNSSASMGAIGVFPLAIALIAQAANGMSPDIAPWANLAAVGVIVAMFIWLLTVHIPNREKVSEQRQDTREARFESRLDKINEQFLQALKYREDSSRMNAESGHGALARLMELQMQVISSNKETTTVLSQLHEQQKEVCSRMEQLNRGIKNG